MGDGAILTKPANEFGNIDKLGQWIPVYRAELEDAREKAVEDGDASKIEYCDKELLWLEAIETELKLK